MSLPSKLYRLAVVPGGNPLGYRQKGGGTFSSLANMQERIDDLNRTGVLYEIYEADLDWKKIGGSTLGFDPLRTDTLPFDQ
jgi:hypothetical protein